MKALVLKFAMLLFSQLPPEEGICRVYDVHRERAYPNYWWACGSCYRDERFYLATMLLACTEKMCLRVPGPTPRNADLGTCERKQR